MDILDIWMAIKILKSVFFEIKKILKKRRDMKSKLKK